MRGALLKILTVVMSGGGLVVAGMVFSSFWTVYEEVQSAAAPVAYTLEPTSQHASNAHAPAAAAHGGGHGAPPAADAHGGGHGGGGEHGAPPAEAHGGGHGGGAPPIPGTENMPALVSIEEVISNINSSENNQGHLLGVKLELELFEDSSRGLLDQHQAGIRNTILLTSMEQSFEQLSSLSGKLYYKEILVSRMNDFFKQPVVRDIHFSSFYLQ